MKGIGAYRIFVTDTAEAAFPYYPKTEIKLILRYFYKPNWIKEMLIYIISIASVILSYIFSAPIYTLISICVLLLIKYLADRRIDV